jgi:hypothetical protein
MAADLASPASRHSRINNFHGGPFQTATSMGRVSAELPPDGAEAQLIEARRPRRDRGRRSVSRRRRYIDTDAWWC